jgi:hypothetical protein
MTKEQMAEVLNGREYGNEITKAEEKAAKEAGLVVIFGASDDLCELRGAIDDELGAYQEAMIFIGKDGVLPEIEDDDIAVLKKHGVLGAVVKLHDQATQIFAFWCKTPEYSFTYETTAPHATFDVMEDGTKFCRGIVLDLKELAQATPATGGGLA